MKLVRLPERPGEWDKEIQGFASKTFFHESAWLDFVLATRPRSTVEYFQIRRNGSNAGYFCAVRARKILFTLYGSPLPGTGMYLGPLVNGGVDQAELIQALVWLSRSSRIACLELANDWLDPDVMRALGFTVSSGITHICPLPADETAVWNGMRGTCRTRIRKAQKSGLEAEVTHDPAIVDQFYRYLTEVLPRKGKRPEYGIQTPRSLMAFLLPADRVLPVWVKLEGKVIGAAFYPHDDHTLYYWDGASDPDCLHLCPNELLHWTAMKEAIRRGLTMFNMGGAPEPSRFTRKFGGRDAPYSVYRRSFIPFLETARGLYHRLRFPQRGAMARADR